MKACALNLILALTIFAPQFALAEESHAVACEVKILSPSQARELVKANYKRELASVPGLQRAYLWLNSYSLRRAILKECTDAGKCTAEELGKAVTRKLQETNLPAIVPYAMLAGALAANAALNAGVVYLAPDAAKPFAGALMGQIAILSAVAIAPLVQPISSRIGQYFWGATRTPSARSTGSAGALHELAPAINSSYTLMAQHSADRVTNLRLLLGDALRQIEIAMDRDDHDRVIFWLGDFAMNAYRMYREVPIDDPSILRAAMNSSLRQRHKNPLHNANDLLERTLVYIREQNPQEFAAPGERSGELSPAAYYTGLLRTLLGLGH
jgi:hypothetical protein